MRRIALEGDVVGSRVPPPRAHHRDRRIHQPAGDLEEKAMREQALAGILGVAGPTQPLGWISNTQPLAMVDVTNDRPAGPAQPTIPLAVLVRSDFVSAVKAAIAAVHQYGATMPFASPPVLQLPIGTARCRTAGRHSQLPRPRAQPGASRRAGRAGHRPARDRPGGGILGPVAARGARAHGDIRHRAARQLRRDPVHADVEQHCHADGGGARPARAGPRQRGLLPGNPAAPAAEQHPDRVGDVHQCHRADRGRHPPR